MDINLSEIKKKIHETVATNNNDLYKSHLYWSQKPFNICDILIESFSENGDVIMDPFMGSGVSVIEALDNRFDRKAIGIEINDVPIFIVKTLLSKYDLNEVSKKVEEFVNRVRQLNKYYETTCTRCGKIGVIQKVIFDKKDFNSNPNIKEVYYKCSCNKKALVKLPDMKDIESLNGKYSINNINNVQLISNTRLAVYDGEKINDIFTNRNFAILDKIIGYINEENEDVARYLKYIVLSIIHLSKITDTHSNSQWPLWIPKTNCVEKNIVELFEKRSKLFLKSIIYADQKLSKTRREVESFNNLQSGNFIIIQNGVQNITNKDIPDNSIDLVITDPPYLGQVLYSEYMQLYKPFLGLSFDLDNEIVVSNSAIRNKKEEDYYNLLKDAFEKIASKLKNGKYMCMYFHDSNLETWNNLINIMNECGLRYLSQIHIKKKNTLKNIITPKKSLNGDAILFFIKDTVKQNNMNKNEKSEEIEEIEEIEYNIVKHIKYMINEKGSLSTPELYDEGLMEFIIHNGWLEKLSLKYKTLVDIFEKHLIWDCQNSKWKL